MSALPYTHRYSHTQECTRTYKIPESEAIASWYGVSVPGMCEIKALGFISNKTTAEESKANHASALVKLLQGFLSGLQKVNFLTRASEAPQRPPGQALPLCAPATLRPPSCSTTHSAKLLGDSAGCSQPLPSHALGCHLSLSCRSNITSPEAFSLASLRQKV